MSSILTRGIDCLTWLFHRSAVVLKWRDLGMPIYEYECTKCGHHTEALQKFSDPPLSECDACHSHKLKKLISQSTFHLKGTGWYVTDYASKSKPNSAAPKKTDKPKASDSPKSSNSQKTTKASSDSSAA